MNIQADAQKILVVEDHYINQTVIKAQLHKLGRRWELAANGLHALEALAKRRFALILMDIYMPEMDGLDTTRRIRKMEQQLNLPGVPILAITSYHSDDLRQFCLHVGMNEFLPRPLGLQELRRALKHWLGD